MQVQSSTIVNDTGKILLFGFQHFIDEIVKGDCCFICGAKRGSKHFNDEHIIPDWVLKRFNLHAKCVNLTNATQFRYGQYKVPCCKDCNTELGKYYEEPISNLLSKPYREVVQDVQANNNLLELLFKWLSLVFFKTHYKDTTLFANRDRRIKSGLIGDSHDWEGMHHIHCVARSHYTGAIIEKSVYGTMYILPALYPDNFDYVDSSFGKGMMIQLGETCILAVLDDSCACASVFAEDFRKITGPLSPFQLRHRLQVKGLRQLSRAMIQTQISRFFAFV